VGNRSDALRQVEEGADALGRERGGGREDDAHDDAVVAFFGKVSLQNLIAPARLDIRAEDAHVRGGHLEPEKGRPHHSEQGERRQQDRDGPSHDPACGSVPEPLARSEARNRQGPCVNLGTEHGEEGGKKRQREHDRERDHDRPSDPHGKEERAAEEHEPGEPRSYGEAGEAHDAPRAFERARERLRVVAAGRELFAIPA
jgi:hypothetical protein